MLLPAGKAKPSSTNEWKLNDDVVSYVKIMGSFIPDKVLKESILESSREPGNVFPCKVPLFINKKFARETILMWENKVF